MPPVCPRRRRRTGRRCRRTGPAPRGDVRVPAVHRHVEGRPTAGIFAGSPGRRVQLPQRAVAIGGDPDAAAARGDGDRSVADRERGRDPIRAGVDPEQAPAGAFAPLPPRVSKNAAQRRAEQRDARPQRRDAPAAAPRARRDPAPRASPRPARRRLRSGRPGSFASAMRHHVLEPGRGRRRLLQVGEDHRRSVARAERRPARSGTRRAGSRASTGRRGRRPPRRGSARGRRSRSCPATAPRRPAPPARRAAASGRSRRGRRARARRAARSTA